MMTIKVPFVLGNECKFLVDEDVYEWTVFVDILHDEDRDRVTSVVFRSKNEGIRSRTNQRSSIPKLVYNEKLEHNVWRFSATRKTRKSSRQICFMNIHFAGGLKITRYRKVRFNKEIVVSGRNYAYLHGSKCISQPRNLIKSRRFGIELELTSAQNTKPYEIAQVIQKRSNQRAKEMSYLEGKRQVTSNIWKIVPDGSIACARERPDCNTFELVSPPLSGDKGLNNKLFRVLRAINAVGSIQVNKSMGFHVHIEVTRQQVPISSLLNLCINFCIFEDVMDSFMPPSRRSNSNNQFCKSNKEAVGRKMRQLIHCNTIDEICDIMNPGYDRYYKLNLLNLRDGSKETVEFRQHSSTSNFEKISSWVRFCHAFVTNSLQGASPDGRFTTLSNENDKFDALFEFVIKDRYLHSFYMGRRREIAKESEEEGACSKDGACSKACCGKQ